MGYRRSREFCSRRGRCVTPLPFSARLQERSAIHTHDSRTRLFLPKQWIPRVVPPICINSRPGPRVVPSPEWSRRSVSRLQDLVQVNEPHFRIAGRCAVVVPLLSNMRVLRNYEVGNPAGHRSITGFGKVDVIILYKKARSLAYVI